MISIGTLLAFSCICLGILVLRYPPQRASHTNVSLHGGVGGSVNANSNNKDGWVTCCGGGGRSWISVFLTTQTVANMMIARGGALEFLWGRVLLAAVLCAMLGAILALARTAQAQYDTKFKVPLVPWLPCAGIAVNTHLILGLPGSAITRLIAWTAVGAAIYFGYGIRHSKLN